MGKWFLEHFGTWKAPSFFFSLYHCRFPYLSPSLSKNFTHNPQLPITSVWIWSIQILLPALHPPMSPCLSHLLEDQSKFNNFKYDMISPPKSFITRMLCWEEPIFLKVNYSTFPRINITICLIPFHARSFPVPQSAILACHPCPSSLYLVCEIFGTHTP